MKTPIAIVCAALVSLSAGCSSAKVRVLPGEKGIHRAIARDKDPEGAEEAAYDEAKEYCEEMNRRAVFLEEKSKYTGTMDEGTRNTIRGASKGAQIVGALGNSSALFGIGTIGRSATSDRDYKASLRFKCKR